MHVTYLLQCKLQFASLNFLLIWVLCCATVIPPRVVEYLYVNQQALQLWLTTCMQNYHMSFECCDSGMQGDVKKVTDDVLALKPSIFAAVPRVLDRMKSGIEAKIKKQPGFKQAIFRVAYNIKRFTRRLGRFDFVSLYDPHNAACS